MTKTKMVPLESIQFSDAYVLKHLNRFLENASHYKNFDPMQTCWVYGMVKRDNDFVGFESREYTLGFSSNNYRLSCILSSELSIASCAFAQLFDYVKKVSGSYA